MTGMNIGLLKMNSSPVISFNLFYNSSPMNATIMIAVQAYVQTGECFNRFITILCRCIITEAIVYSSTNSRRVQYGIPSGDVSIFTNEIQ